VGTAIHLTVTVPAAECKKAYNQTLKTIRHESVIEGFRKGAMIPEEIILEHMGDGKGLAEGRKVVHQYAIENALKKAMRSVLLSLDGREILADSERILTSSDDLLSTYRKDADLVFRIAVDLPPKLRFTSPYKDVKVAVTGEGSPADDEKIVAQQLLAFQRSNAQVRRRREGVVLPCVSIDLPYLPPT
jgi:FKBP-type peptidyl-prolyl cis-trans isomerase (trigger factor)